ncbi:MAG: helix-turn-helix domain-containing protein [Deltaproteobacteria bacterium]|nr:helix-turn-helix domain-containing protein [Deltaproteobacteria bacterium]
MEMQQRAYSVAEAAQILRVSQWLVREACRRGEIRSLRLGTRVIIPRDAIEQFLAAGLDEGIGADS